MGIRIVRLGSARAPGEGLRIGTVRRPPRGIPKAEFASQNWYDVWYPNLAPSANFSMGCYCQDESRCHRSILRDLLIEQGALLQP